MSILERFDAFFLCLVYPYAYIHSTSLPGASKKVKSSMGYYKLQQKKSSGYHVWKHESGGETRYLYRHNDRWHVGEELVSGEPLIKSNKKIGSRNPFSDDLYWSYDDFRGEYGGWTENSSLKVSGVDGMFFVNALSILGKLPSNMNINTLGHP